MRLLGVLGRRVSSGYHLDPAKIVALYHFDTDYNDSSPNARHLTTAGQISIDSSVKKFGDGAMRLDLRVGNGLTGAYAKADNVFNFGNKRPFTISYWLSKTVTEPSIPVFKTTTTLNEFTAIYLACENTIFRNDNFSAVVATPQLTGQDLPINNIVVVGDGTNIKVYVNGIIKGTFAHPNWPSQLYPLFFGYQVDGNISNYTVDEFLLYDGVLWTANFTPPTLPFSV